MNKSVFKKIKGAKVILKNTYYARHYYHDKLKEDLEKVKSELEEKKEKVEEFNSRRICHENCEDASPGEIEKHINSIKDDKENMKIDTDEYKSVEYENYEDDIEE